MTHVFRDELNGPYELVAPRLLGSLIRREQKGEVILVRIVEVEAYDQFDEASHSFRGQTHRTKTMFGQSGHLYVYFTYGMHHCCNIVTGPEGYGSAVLIRAVEPLEGVHAVVQNRPPHIAQKQLTNGPGKLCQALNINLDIDGHDLTQPPIELLLQPRLSTKYIVTTTRIGISRAQDKKWRFYIKDNPYVSKK